MTENELTNYSVSDNALLKEILLDKQKRIYACEHNVLLFSLYYFADFHTYLMPDFHKAMYEDLIYNNGKTGLLWVAFRESSKRQPLTAKILTPTGFKQLGELSVGDYVIGSDGKKTQIQFMSEIVDRPIYQLTTEDGRKTECDSEHLWTVRMMSNVKNKHVTLDTQRMIDAGLFYERKPDYRNNKKEGRIYNEYKFALDTVKPVELEEKKLLIDPYFLGLWLGDGTSCSANITNIDKEVEDYLSEYAKSIGLKFRIRDNHGKRTQTLIVGRGRTGGIHKDDNLVFFLRKLNLFRNKHIPEDYLNGSIAQRKALLEGLMDSDGTVGSGTASFSNKNERIIDGVISLVRSLGGRASKVKCVSYCDYKDKRVYGNYFRVSILFTDYTPFRIKRKRKNHKLSPSTFSRIIDIKLIGNKKGRCIKVSNEDGLYVTDDYILTHNTSLAKMKVIHNICYNKRKFMIWASFDERTAKSNAYDIALELQTNERILEDFGQLYYDPELEEDSDQAEGHRRYSKKKSVGEFITANKIKVKTASTGSTVRGWVYGKYRPDFVCLDDIENIKTVVSEIKTQEVIAFFDELFTGLSGDAEVLVLGNRLSNSGSIQYIQDKVSKEERWTVRDIPIVDNDGKLAWPDKYVFTDEQAKTINATIKDKKQRKISLEYLKRFNGATKYNREYMNTPMTDEEREIKLAWLQHEFTEEEVAKKLRNRYITIDVADSKAKAKNDPDYTATIMVDWDFENNWYVQYANQQRMNAPELIDWIFYIWITYKPIKIGIEKKSLEDQVMPYIKQRSEETQIFPVVVELKHGGTRKEDRIRGALQGRLQYGKIKFKKGATDDTDVLKAELFDFPKAKHEDCADALAYIDQIGHRPLGVAGSAESFMSPLDREFYKYRKSQGKTPSVKQTILKM